MEETIKKASSFNRSWKITVIITALISMGSAKYYASENTNLAKKVIERDSVIMAQTKFIKLQIESLNNLKNEVNEIKQKKFALSYLERQNLIPTVYKTLNGKVLSLNKAYETWFLTPRGFTSQMYIDNGDKKVWPKHYIAFEKLEKAAEISGHPISQYVELDFPWFPDGKFKGEVTVGHLKDENGNPLIVQVVIPITYK